MKSKWWISILIILVCGASFLAWVSVLSFGKVIAGVKIAGVNVGGKDKNATIEILQKEITDNREIILRWGTQTFTITTRDLELAIDYSKTADRAMTVGRDNNIVGNLWQRYLVFKNGYWVEPVYKWNEEKLNGQIDRILAEIEIPAMEPQIILNESNNSIEVKKGQNGIKVDKELLVARIKNDLFGIGPENIEIPTENITPALSEDQVTKTQARAQSMVGKNIDVTDQETNQKWEIEDKQILFWMDPTTGGWKNEEIVKWLNGLAPSINRPAQNASFTFISNNKLQEFKPEIWGEALNTPGSYEKIVEALNKLSDGEKNATAALVTVKISPSVTLAQVNNLGIKELLGKGESWFVGSITNRIFNLKKASAELNGVLVPPGETFSFNKQIGEVSADTGYKQAYVIKEGKTVLGDGGGVCQVSTTLFRAALATGLPILERTAHAYRVSYYEVNYQPGFDATVFQPSPDFKFKNDTPGYVLIQTIYDESKKYLAFELYGTSDGRKAEISKARIWEQTPPPPDLYVDDPTLPVGVVTQTEHAAWGAKVAFDYKVTRGNEVLQNRTFYSNFAPWQAVFLRGTKTQ